MAPGIRKVWLSGKILDNLAVVVSKKDLEQLPILKTALGKSKRIPLQNKILLLRRLRQTKQHRKNAMKSHGDLVPGGSEIVTAEQKLTTALYAQKLKLAYQDAFHFTIHWDPSTYDIDTMVSIIFSIQAGMPGSEGLAALPSNPKLETSCQERGGSRDTGFGGQK